MQNRYVTLRVIYELVKTKEDPTAVILPTGEIIISQHFPWDEISQHLKELEQEGLIHIKQINTAVINITEKGLRFCVEQVVERAA